MEFTVFQEYPSEKFIQTSTGNIISRSTLICKPQALEVPGGKCFINEDVTIRADLAAIQLNRYTQIEKNCILRPCHTLLFDSKNLNSFKFIPLTIGAYTIIQENCIIQAASIGTCCEIGKNCILSERVILKDYVKVLDNTIIPPDMVIPPFAIVGGSPAKILGEQPESVTTIASQLATERYKGIRLTTPATS